MVMDMDAESIDYLVDQTIDVLIVAGWLVQVSVSKETDDDDDDDMVMTSNPDSRIELLMSVDATVHDVKLVAKSHWGIAPKEQRFFDQATGKAVYHGPLVPSVISSPQLEDINLDVKRHALNPKLEALFEMVHMEDDVERDELMSMMTKRRKAGSCHCGQVLAPGMDVENSVITCNMCHFETGIMQNAFMCQDCNYALCSICYNKDMGQTASPDPDKDLVRMAEELGARFAGPASWFGGPGRSCGRPSINFPVEIVPRRYRHSRYVDKVKIDRMTQVLHKGVNVKILFDDDIRHMLTEAGVEDWKSLETDRILPEGATVYDIMCFRSSLMRSSMWPTVEKKLHEKVHRQSAGRDRQPSVLFCNTIMKLCTYNTEEAIFSISAVAHVDNYTYY